MQNIMSQLVGDTETIVEQPPHATKINDELSRSVDFNSVCSFEFPCWPVQILNAAMQPLFNSRANFTSRLITNGFAKLNGQSADLLA